MWWLVWMWNAPPASAATLGCAAEDAVCLAVEAGVAGVHAELGESVYDDAGPTRLRPTRLVGQLRDALATLAADGCAVEGPVIWGAGAYDAASMSGGVGLGASVASDSMSGAIDRDARTMIGDVAGDSLGDLFGRYDSQGRYAANVGADGRFFVARWSRVVGTTGVFVGLQGRCTIPAANGMNRWFAGGLDDVTLPGWPLPGLWQVDPAEPAATEDDLRCVAAISPSDPDDDPLAVDIVWLVDGTTWTGPVQTVVHPGDTVASEVLATGSAWTCIATVTDGENVAESAPSEAAVVRPPVVGGVLDEPPLPLPLGAYPLRLVGIDAGDFDMGCRFGRDDVAGASCTNNGDGAGLRQVTLTRAMFMQETELTQAQWAALAPRLPAPSWFTGDDYPVESVSWHDAAWFTNALSDREGLPSCYSCTGGYAADDAVDPVCAPVGEPYACAGYRLPTEAEWEYAARANEDTPWAGGAIAMDVAWYTANNEPEGTKPVAQLAPNGFGLYDMSGNVFEWTGDYWAAPYDAGPVTDPTGPLSGSLRVRRGGFFRGAARGARVAARSSFAPTSAHNRGGFRVCRSIP